MKISAFDDTIFQRSTFQAPIEYGMTTWRTLSVWSTAFEEDADFSKSRIQEVNWNTSSMRGDFKVGCTMLDFSESTIYRGVLRRMRTEYEMDLRKARIEKAYFNNVKASRIILKEAQFNQERIDGRRCTAVCPEQECRCNYTRPPTDNCPEVPYPADLKAPLNCCAWCAVRLVSRLSTCVSWYCFLVVWNATSDFCFLHSVPSLLLLFSWRFPNGHPFFSSQILQEIIYR